MANVDLELKQSLFDEIEPLLGNADAVKRLKKYVARLKKEMQTPIPPCRYTEEELNEILDRAEAQAAEGKFYTQEEIKKKMEMKYPFLCK